MCPTLLATNLVTHHLTHLYLCVCPTLLATTAVHLVLWKQRILDHIHKSPTLVPNWSQINPVHSQFFPSIQTLTIHFCTSRCHRWSLSLSDFATKLCEHFPSPVISCSPAWCHHDAAVSPVPSPC